MKILVLEDDLLEAERITKMANNYFNGQCEIVGPFTEFRMAVNSIKTIRPDFAIVDIKLGKDRYGGVNFAEVLHQLYGVPLIFISGITDNHLLRQTDQIEFCDFLKKPWQHAGFRKALEKAVHLAKSKKKSIHRTTILPSAKARFWAKLNKGEYQAIPYEDIILIKSVRHYNEILIRNRKQYLLVKGNLQSELFDTHFRFYDNFFLMGRSIVFNRDYVQRVRGSQLFFGINHLETFPIAIPRNWKPKLLEWLEINET